MKARSRLGKTDSIFASTTGTLAHAKSTTKAKVPVRSSIEDKMTVIMPPDQVAFLDRLCLDIRAKTGSKIRGTEVIRALVAGIQTSAVDLTAFGTEADIADAIQKRLNE